MRKNIFLTLLVIGLVVLLAIPAFASSARYGLSVSRPIETSAIATDADGNAMDYGVWVYGISIFADDTSSYMGVYDCDTVTELIDSGTEPCIDEIGEATQYDTAERWYEKPKYFSDGVGVIIFTGVGFIHYGPPPD